MSSAARYARALLETSARLDDVEATAVNDALLPFLARPSPASYVASMRGLRKLTREATVDGARLEHRQRQRGLALELLRDTGPSGAILAEALVHGPLDARAADRVSALACLLGAYEELEARAQLERDEWRRRLGLVSADDD